jgi:hypothetical protein
MHGARRVGALHPDRRLYFAWAIFAMMMGGTNFGCRYIDHRYLEGVHEGFFALTLLVVAVLLPRMAWLAFVVPNRKETGRTIAA